MGRAISDLSGNRYGRLVALSHLRKPGKKKMYWLCLCDCGQQKVVRMTELLSGASKSCGCLRRDLGGLNKTHGQSKTPLYRAWIGMIARTESPNDKHYLDYGGRGIKVCQEWRSSFEAFAEHVGPQPAFGMSLDRINNNGNYEPGNVRWATRLQQAQNKRNNVYVELDGETVVLAEAARRLSMSPQGAAYRLKIGRLKEAQLSLL